MKKEYLLALLLVLCGALLRFLPHPPNFAPIAALALFGSVYLPKRFGILIPLIALFVSDWFIGWYHPFIMGSVYGSFVLIGIIGWWVQQKKNILQICIGSLSGSILFYLITNAAVWAWSGMYPLTVSGLGQSYFLALPFFRNTLLGDLFYTGVLFGLFESIRSLMFLLANSRGTVSVGR